MKLTISDRALALLQLDTELDRLDCEENALRLQLEQCQARQVIIRKAMMSIHEDGIYYLRDEG